MSDYYDRNGSPMQCMDWAAAFAGDRTIGRDEIGDVLVSTVWLGLDHNFDPSGPPLIFETMVFGGENDQWIDRYWTEEQAIAGHARVVAAIRAGEHPWQEDLP